MSDYKRLTGQKWSDNIDLTQELGYSYIYKRLYELENKLENGTLIELPRLYTAKEGCYTLYVINYLSKINGGLMEYATLDKEKAVEMLKELKNKE